jgi:hypothetical protein
VNLLLNGLDGLVVTAIIYAGSVKKKQKECQHFVKKWALRNNSHPPLSPAARFAPFMIIREALTVSGLLPNRHRKNIHG